MQLAECRMVLRYFISFTSFCILQLVAAVYIWFWEDFSREV